MRIRLTGNTLQKPGMFSVIIDWLFGLGLEDSIRKVDEEASRQDPALPVWVFAKQVPSPWLILQVSHVLAILEAIARRCVSMNSYRELRFEFFGDGNLVAKGCVTRPNVGRLWCAGLYGGSEEQSLFGNTTVAANVS